MAYPEWVTKHKKKGTSIRCTNGRYYLSEYSTIWSKEKKRAKKVTGKYLGVISQEHGLIPPGGSRKGPVPKGAAKFKEEPKTETDFLDHFEDITDVRATRNRLYTVDEILLVTFLAVICGAEGWQDVETFGKAKLDYLRTFFDFNNGIPSDDTFRRFFRSVDPEYFKQLFREWVQDVAQLAGSKVIAIDGKCSRRSHDGPNTMLHMVSAFASEARIVLGQEKVTDKSNEITAIPILLNTLDIKGHIITIDAMGCQFEIANTIVGKEAEYIFSLKGNQGNLNDDVRLYFNDIVLKTEGKTFTDYDKGHGRIETRECIVCNDVVWLTGRHAKWQSIKSIVQINSMREIKDTKTGTWKETRETRYYISSWDTTPEAMLRAIRWHWGIENSLHWVLDMSFNEDWSRIRKGNAPEVMAIIRHIVLNILQQNRPPRTSIKGLRKLCGWSDDMMTQIVSQKKSS